jgi:mRNA-degrading endonuclease RelE of RelBE toxin-antitoxin system
MRLEVTRRARRQYEALPEQLRDRVDRQLSALLSDLRHPSLRAKKYDERRDIWQGRVNRDYRFYFTIEGDTYRILSIIPHPK